MSCRCQKAMRMNRMMICHSKSYQLAVILLSLYRRKIALIASRHTAALARQRERTAKARVRGMIREMAA